MICPIFKAIEIVGMLEERAKFAVLSNFQSGAVPAFCRCYTRRLMNLALRDPKNRHLYVSIAESLVRLHKRIGPGLTFEDMELFDEDCKSFGITI